LATKEHSINAHLGSSFKDPRAIRSVQAQCDAIITGSFARRFFNGYRQRDLGLVVDWNVHAMCRFLETNGYEITSDSSSQPDSDSDDDSELRIWVFKKLWSDDRISLMSLFICYAQPALVNALELAFPTADLAFITWNKAYSLLPYTTYLKKDTYLLEEPKSNSIRRQHVARFEKDGLRGRLVRTIDYDDNRPAECKLLDRLCRVGDRHRWNISLDTEGVKVKLIHMPAPCPSYMTNYIHVPLAFTIAATGIMRAVRVAKTSNSSERSAWAGSKRERLLVISPLSAEGHPLAASLSDCVPLLNEEPRAYLLPFLPSTSFSCNPEAPFNPYRRLGTRRARPN
jgi:hypothetical protein